LRSLVSLLKDPSIWM